MADHAPIVVYPFRKRDPLTGKWYRARWKASAELIAEHAGEWIVDGPPEVYQALGPTSGFQRARPYVAGRFDAGLQLDPQRAEPPAIDARERFLARLFLRRYVTYCTRRAQHARAAGAATLWRELLDADAAAGTTP
jgi:hypothetical protein